MTEGPCLFELQGVTVGPTDAAGRARLGPVDLALHAHGPILIAGPSGSGKSTLLRLLNGLEAPSAGEVRYRGEPLRDREPTTHRREVAMVFQRPVVLPGTVADNLRAAEPALTDDAVADLLADVGLDPALRTRAADELSGGEAQRMCLARSLATRPQVLLFDEPTSSLDPTSAARIEDLARTLQERGVVVLWVTHDLDQLRRLAHQVVVVIDGRIAQAGHLADVLAGPTPDVARFLATEAGTEPTATSHAADGDGDGEGRGVAP